MTGKIIQSVFTGQRLLVEREVNFHVWAYPDCDKSNPLTWMLKTDFVIL